MVQITFSIKIDPKVGRIITQGGVRAISKMSDRFLINTAKTVQEEMRKQAPVRSGTLRAGIIVTARQKLGGGLDRRALINVDSTAPHSRYVVAGARPSIGDGSPGTGQYFGPAYGRFPATKGWTGGKAFRSGSGFYPGFRINDFISRAARTVIPKIVKSARFIGVRSYSDAYNQLGIKFT